MPVLYVRCCCRAGAAPAVCCCRAVLCSACCTMCHTMKINAQKSFTTKNITSIIPLLYVLGRKSAHLLIIFGENMFHAGRYRYTFWHCVNSIDVCFSNNHCPNNYIPGIQFVALNVPINIIIVRPRVYCWLRCDRRAYKRNTCQETPRQTTGAVCHRRSVTFVIPTLSGMFWLVNVEAHAAYCRMSNLIIIGCERVWRVITTPINSSTKKSNSHQLQDEK